MAIQKLEEVAAAVKAAARVLSTASTDQKDAALHAAAGELIGKSDEILSANELDRKEAVALGATSTVIDRLTLTEARLSAMAKGLADLAALADPVGEVTGGWVRPNGLRIRQVRVPLGVVGVIYENRPNVTSDAAGICLKSGNAAFLRGSSGAINSNLAIAAALRAGVVQAALPVDCVALVEDVSRESAIEFMRLRGFVDCLIPRGGPSLIASIRENATVPFVIDSDGNCHVYVDHYADLEMAERIVVNAKTHRPGVCNAAETLLVHQDVAAEFLPRVRAEMHSVELRVDGRAREFLPDCRLATDEDFAHEFLDLIMTVAVVSDVDEAIDHICRYGSGHSEAIVTQDLATSNRFVNEVDAAAVLVNASTRFVDGGEFGFGAEIGISTQKLHCRGPMGLRELTTLKYVVEGEGQIRA